jgi:hypothetical protein
MEETSTNIYLPSAFTNVNHPEMSVQDDLHHHQSARIYVTGAPSSITRAKDMLNKLYVQKVIDMIVSGHLMYPRNSNPISLRPNQCTKRILYYILGKEIGF